MGSHNILLSRKYRVYHEVCRPILAGQTTSSFLTQISRTYPFSFEPGNLGQIQVRTSARQIIVIILNCVHIRPLPPNLKMLENAEYSVFIKASPASYPPRSEKKQPWKSWVKHVEENSPEAFIVAIPQACDHGSNGLGGY